MSLFLIYLLYYGYSLTSFTEWFTIHFIAWQRSNKLIRFVKRKCDMMPYSDIDRYSQLRHLLSLMYQPEVYWLSKQRILLFCGWQNLNIKIFVCIQSVVLLESLPGCIDVYLTVFWIPLPKNGRRAILGLFSADDVNRSLAFKSSCKATHHTELSLAWRLECKSFGRSSLVRGDAWPTGITFFRRRDQLPTNYRL